MTDQEINAQLARAIGWDYVVLDRCKQVWVGMHGHIAAGILDYRDPAVIWSVAEHFDCFPWFVAPNAIDPWASKIENHTEFADTAAKAVALAVIKMKDTKP